MLTRTQRNIIENIIGRKLQADDIVHVDTVEDMEMKREVPCHEMRPDLIDIKSLCDDITKIKRG